MDVLYILGLILSLAVLGLWAWPRIVDPWLEQKAWRLLASRQGLVHRERRILGIPTKGRISGLRRGRQCTVETLREPGAGPNVRIMLSVSQEVRGSFLLVGRRPPGPPVPGEQTLHVAQSDPHDLVSSAQLEGRIEQAIRDLGATGVRISLIAHLLRLEYRPHRLRGYRVSAHADRLSAAIDALCDLAEAVEAVYAV